MDLLKELNWDSTPNDDPLIVFDPDSVGPSKTTNDQSAKMIKPYKENKLELKDFDDQSLAQDYVCKICQFMAVNPREHNMTEQTATCSALFCDGCISAWIKSGKSFCPSPRCLTIGFEESAFREIGVRDLVRLSSLIMNCPFSCGSKMTYSDYTTSHRNKCPANPDNVCKICKSVKVDSSGEHNCRIVFNEMQQKIDSLNNKVTKLNAVIDQLRIELDSTKKELKKNSGQSDSKKETVNKDKKGSDHKGKDKTDKALNKSDRKSHQNITDKKTSGKQSASETWCPFSGPVINKSKEPNKLMVTFYSNNYLHKNGSTAINLVFHYGEKLINFDDVQPTYTIRTLRSLITDTLGHDPGTMLLVRHKQINDKDIVKNCGFRNGKNYITILPIDTPNYGEPGFRLSLYLPRFGTKSTDENKQNKLLNFFSNNLDSKAPEFHSNRIKLMLVSDAFVSDGSGFTVDAVKMSQSMGEIWHQTTTIVGKKPVRMLYLTHSVLEDAMTVNHYALSPGTTDITCFPTDHFGPDKFGQYGSSVKHFTRFLTNKSHGNKPHQSAKSTSLASLV